MTYHINFKGEAGQCKALRACPFGDFETQHYTTKEQAQAAYEASMVGETVASFTTRDAHMAIVQSENQEEERKAIEAEKARLARLTYLKTFVMPSSPKPGVLENGHIADVEHYAQLKKRDVLADGTVIRSVTRIHARQNYVNVRYHEKDDNFNHPPREKVILASTRVEGETWRRSPDPELAEAHEAIRNERVLEDSFLNYARPKKARLFRAKPNFSADYLKIYSDGFKAFEEKLEELKKSGISMPYTRAYEHVSDQGFGGSSRSIGERESLEAFQAIMRQEDTVKSHSVTIAIDAIFPEGKRPFGDFNPRRLSKERRDAGLL